MAHEPGPYSVEVTFSDGTKLVVLKEVSEHSAVSKFNDHVHGLGAMVGTTKKVRIITGEYCDIAVWEYKRHD